MVNTEKMASRLIPDEILNKTIKEILEEEDINSKIKIGNNRTSVKGHIDFCDVSFETGGIRDVTVAIVIEYPSEGSPQTRKKTKRAEERYFNI